MAVTVTDLPLRLQCRGKVRDVYSIDDNRLLLVATDRISAFDVVMNETIPHKGAVLTQLTAWWLRRLEGRVRHHMISADIGEIIDAVPEIAAHASELNQRTMLCERARAFPIECVIRGYISGSAWKEYSSRGTLAGERLPANLRESEKLAEAIFSPATKAEAGHDENITVDRMREIIGIDQTSELERLTREVYEFGSSIAAERGIIIADTKLEFGYTARDAAEFVSAGVILIDEVLTPDSSRFWPADRYEPGRSQPSFDKQPLRDYLDEQRRAGGWNGDYPAPSLPAEVVLATSERYLEIFRLLTGKPLQTSSFD